MEVMGLMLGEFVDDYTVRCIDVFAMPQTGTGVSVEAVDSVYQQAMQEMLKQTGRQETVVGWYHSHPGPQEPSHLRLRLLAVRRRSEHSARLRNAQPSLRRRRRRPHPKRPRQSRHRCLPSHQPPHRHGRKGAETDDVERGPRAEADIDIVGARFESALLQPGDQLQEERVGAKDADELVKG
jgi:hypothetical protein